MKHYLILLIFAPIIFSSHKYIYPQAVNPTTVKKDTIINNACLVDTITQEMVEHLPIDFALCIRFRIKNNPLFPDLDVMIYNPDAYPKDFFSPGKTYFIEGNYEVKRIVFRFVKEHPNRVPFFNCHSIKIAP